ncbi:unnamed protein product [Lactuca saligna]|uniref:Uncharacterized protein n=1 Tax=Lactuca saligna TaxID=75948 RepID=A0AA35UUG3_LACSI|nr:unnamed protein product [Lactuca saligna]
MAVGGRRPVVHCGGHLGRLPWWFFRAFRLQAHTRDSRDYRDTFTSKAATVGTTPVTAGCGCEQRQKEKKKENDGEVASGTHSFVGGCRCRRQQGTTAVWLERSIMDGEEVDTDRRLRFHLHLSTSSSLSRKRASETRSIAKSLGFASFSLITTTLLLLATITAAQTRTPTPPSPPPASDSCNGVYLSYTYTSGSKLPPNRTSYQPYRFESTLRVLNNADEELKSWRVFVGFLHDEYLVSASNAVIADGSATFPGPVRNYTIFAVFPSADLKTTIETAGDVNQMSVEVDFVGMQFRVDSPTVPMPSNISLVNDGFVFPRPSMQDISPLAGMDGLLGVSAYDADKNCTCLFVSSKATPYQSIPTMVGSMISIRLLTAPATTLFPSLESESHKIFMNQNEDSKDHHPNAPKFRVRTTINEGILLGWDACYLDMEP